MTAQDKERAAFRKMRQKLGLSQQQLSDKSKVWQSKISLFEQGKIDLTQDDLWQIGEALDSVLIQMAEEERLAPSQLDPPVPFKGKEFRARREKLNFSQKQIAERARISCSTLSIFERGFAGVATETEADINLALDSLVRDRIALQKTAGPTLSSLAHAMPARLSVESIKKAPGFMDKIRRECAEQLFEELKSAKDELKQAREELRIAHELIAKYGAALKNLDQLNDTVTEQNVHLKASNEDLRAGRTLPVEVK
jgi:transcriptional regulator with XRE-family HTH domain